MNQVTISTPVQTVVNFVKVVLDIPYFIFLFLRAFIPIVLSFVLPQRRKSLDGETILITGAASGVGRLVAENIAKKSTATLVLWDINETGLRETSEKCKVLGANVHWYVVDLTNKVAVSTTAAMVRRDVNDVTILFNNAGVAFGEPFVTADSVREETTIKVNLLSYLWVTREFLPQMIRQGRGHIVATASGIALARMRSLASYAGSKHGVKGFMDSLRLEMKLHSEKPNIKVTTIYPGFIKTPMTSGFSWKPRYTFDWLSMLEPEFVADGIIDGIEQELDEIMVPNTLKFIGWFYGILPTKFMDDLECYLYKDLNLNQQLPESSSEPKTLTKGTRRNNNSNSTKSSLLLPKPNN